MQGIIWRDGQDLFKEDLEFEQASKEAEILRRTTDMFSFGIISGFVLVPQPNNIHVNSAAENGGTYNLGYDGSGKFLFNSLSVDVPTSSFTDTNKYLVVRYATSSDTSRVNPETGVSEPMHLLDGVAYSLVVTPLATDIVLAQITSFTGSQPVLGQTVPTQRSTAFKPQLPAGSIGSTELADGSVTTPKIADLAVTTPKIADAAVTLVKLGPDVPLASSVIQQHQKDEHVNGILIPSNVSFLTGTLNPTGVDSVTINTVSGTDGGIYVGNQKIAPQANPTILFTDVLDVDQGLYEIYINSAGVVGKNRRAQVQAGSTLQTYFQLVDASEDIVPGLYPLSFTFPSNVLRFDTGVGVTLDSANRVVTLFSQNGLSWIKVAYQASFLPGGSANENLTFFATAQSSTQSVFITTPFSGSGAGFLGYGATSPLNSGVLNDKRRYGTLSYDRISSDFKARFFDKPLWYLLAGATVTVEGFNWDDNGLTGLNILVGAGHIYRDGRFTTVAPRSFTLTDNSTTFIYVDSSGVLQQILSTAPNFATVFAQNNTAFAGGAQNYRVLKIKTVAGNMVYVDPWMRVLYPATYDGQYSLNGSSRGVLYGSKGDNWLSIEALNTLGVSSSYDLSGSTLVYDDINLSKKVHGGSITFATNGGNVSTITLSSILDGTLLGWTLGRVLTNPPIIVSYGGSVKNCQAVCSSSTPALATDAWMVLAAVKGFALGTPSRTEIEGNIVNPNTVSTFRPAKFISISTTQGSDVIVRNNHAYQATGLASTTYFVSNDQSLDASGTYTPDTLLFEGNKFDMGSGPVMIKGQSFAVANQMRVIVRGNEWCQTSGSAVDFLHIGDNSVLNNFNTVEVTKNKFTGGLTNVTLNWGQVLAVDHRINVSDNNSSGASGNFCSVMMGALTAGRVFLDVSVNTVDGADEVLSFNPGSTTNVPSTTRTWTTFKGNKLSNIQTAVYAAYTFVGVNPNFATTMHQLSIRGNSIGVGGSLQTPVFLSENGEVSSSYVIGENDFEGILASGTSGYIYCFSNNPAGAPLKVITNNVFHGNTFTGYSIGTHTNVHIWIDSTAGISAASFIATNNLKTPLGGTPLTDVFVYNLGKVPTFSGNYPEFVVK